MEFCQCLALPWHNFRVSTASQAKGIPEILVNLLTANSVNPAFPKTELDRTKEVMLSCVKNIDFHLYLMSFRWRIVPAKSELNLQPTTEGG